MSIPCNTFDAFFEHLYGGVHDLFGTAGAGANTCKLYLSNTLPVSATHAVKASLAEFAGGTGYAAGGASIANVGTRSGGIFTLAGTDIIWTAGAADWNPFRYIVLYNDTPTSPADPLMLWWDFGPLVLGIGQTFSSDFGSSILSAYALP